MFPVGDYGQRLPFAPNTAIYRTERNYRLIYRTGVLSIAGGLLCQYSHRVMPLL
jgi:predicted small secreted protein